jgi:O-antigen/teichoic acid export membrane protein
MRRFAYDLIFYFGCLLASKAMAFSSLILLASLLLPADFGLYGLFSAATVLLQPAFSLNNHVGFAKTSTQLSRHDSARLLSSLVARYLLKVPIVLAAAILIDLILIRSQPTWYLTSVSTFFLCCQQLFMAHARAHSSRFQFISSDLLKNAAFLLAIFIFKPQTSLFAMFLYVFCQFFSTAVGAAVSFKDFSITKISHSSLDDLHNDTAAISLPTIPTTYAAFLSNQSGKFIIRGFLGLELLGAFSFFQSIGTAVSLLFDSVVLVIQPWYFRSSRPDKKKLLLVIALAPVIIGLACVIPVYYLIPYFDAFFPAAYSGYGAVASIIFLNMCLRGGYQMCQIWFTDQKNLVLFSRFYILTSITSLLATVLLIPAYSISGAAAAMALGSSLLFLLSSISMFKDVVNTSSVLTHD